MTVAWMNSERQESYPYVPVADLDDIIGSLALAGVHEGYRERRHELAADLLQAGWSSDDIELLAGWIRRRHPRTQNKAGMLSAILCKPEERQERLEDIRDVARIQLEAAQAAENAVSDRFSDRADQEPEQEVWSEEDRAVAVSTRVDVDLVNRWGDGGEPLTEDEKLSTVAGEFGIEVAMAAHLLPLGRKIRESRLTAYRERKLPKPKPRSQQLAEFRRFLETGEKPKESA